MLKLQRVKINGFKTFVDPVDVAIAEGVTAIVGPNGCGKSNLSDAITWVLGEQSAKSLRGTKMEDVIFSGSSTRKPVGMAEVDLTLATDPSFSAAIDGKVVISRRVFRSGQSQYRLNGKVVRLKEIKDLLMDTGLGIRAYAVIEQGRIGMILSGKPQERRRLLEEAAGITRYKARKRIAEIKLEEATANLLRIDDIVSEVERALRSLKRQASAARRFKEREATYRELFDEVLRGRWYTVRTRLVDLGERLQVATDEDAELAAALHTDEATLAEGREALDAMARTLAEHHERQAEMTGVIEGRQAFLSGARETIEDIGQRLTRGTNDTDARQGHISELVLAMGELDTRTKALVGDRDEAARLVAEDDAAIAAAQQGVERAEGRVSDERQGLLSSLGRIEQLRARVQGQVVEIERGTLRSRYLTEERERLDRQRAEADRRLAELNERLGSMEQSLAARSAEREDGNKALDELLRHEQEIAEQRRTREAELGALRQRQRILVELSEEHEERRQATLERLAAIGIDTPRFLAEALQAASGWERSVDHYLGELADALLLDEGDDPLALASMLAAADASGVLVKPLAGGGTAPAEIDDPAIAMSLAEALGLPESLARALPPAYLVEDAASAARLAAVHAGVAFLSRDRVWSLGGVLYVQGDEAAPGVLARSRELAGIRERIPELERELDAAKQALEKTVADRGRWAASLQQLDDQIAELRREMAVGQARRQDATTRREGLESTHQTIADEQAELGATLRSVQAAQTAQAEALATAETEHKSREEAFDQAQAAVDTAKEEREKLRTAGAGRRGRLELLEERLETQAQEALRLRRQTDETENLVKRWAEEAETLGGRKQELETAVGVARKELQEALDRRAVAQEAVLAEQARLDERREALQALEERVRETREVREALRNSLESLRVEQASIDQRGEHLAVEYRDAFAAVLPDSHLAAELDQAERLAAEAAARADEDGEGGDPRSDADAEAVSPDTAAVPAHLLPQDAAAGTEAPKAGGEAPQDDPGTTSEADAESATDAESESDAEDSDAEAEDVPSVRRMAAEDIVPIDPERLAELERQLVRAKEAVDKIGPVNVLAAEEYDEQQERHDFLTEQRADVADSVKRLKETIQEINQTSGERFREAFAAVNQAFGETFTKLFRGGEAEMRLLDEDDVLDSGIEIIARPPGKRPQNIMLLSGGEKALTAIALLFALFQTKPSPFCILDEVDAPLDDANVLRFVELLQEMSQETQFLIITHNKLTMEVASTLYGVTMEEKGISKLVSVELDEVDPALSATA